MPTMGSRIRELRRENNDMSQEAFAKSVRMTRSMVSNLEHDLVRIDQLKVSMIAEKYGVMEEWLISGELPKYKPANIPTTMDETIAMFSGLVTTLPDGAIQKRILHGLAKLTDEDWIALESILNKLLESRTTPPAPEDEAPPTD